MENSNETDGLTNLVMAASSAQGENVDSTRPRLRKIKRPKPKPAGDLLQTPQKIIPQQPLSDDSSFVSAPIDNPTSDLSEREKKNQGTELITSSEIRDIADERKQGNPYILEALPPELDYIADGDGASYVDGADYVKKKFMFSVALFCLVIGLFMGKIFFASKKVEMHGLEGVVLNPDVPAGRPRCGMTDKSQACIFYLMNWYRQELTGRDFYRLAAQLTDREEYMIETENLRYTTVKIKPGHFAQLNIPALK